MTDVDEPGLGQDFDRLALESHLRRRLDSDARITRLVPTVGGLSNPTYFLDFGDRRLVLRKQPPGPIARSAHAVDREYRVLCALQDADVPVPAPVYFEEDASIVGTPFYLMEAVAGEVFQQASMPGLTPDRRRACYLSMAETMARLHRLDWREAGLEGYGPAGNYFSRQLSRWSRYWREEAHRANPALDDLIAWLEANPQPDELATLCHGDLKLNNFIFDVERGQVAAVIDWELSTIGHPFADAAFNCMAFNTTSDEFGGLRDCDLASLGIPDQDEYLGAYYAALGKQERLSGYHLAFAFFRAAVGSESVRHRAAAGPVSEAYQVGARLGELFATRGLEIAHDTERA